MSDSHETGLWDPPTVDRASSEGKHDTSPLLKFSQNTDTQTPRIGKYLIRGMLGMGGMGVVYRGYDPVIEREVAIKVLPQEFTANEIAFKRFLQEARSAGRVNHPNVATIYETGEQEGCCFLVMELLAGGSVANLIKQRPLTWRRATTLIRDCCRGLKAMHAEGLVHRDIKPGNLLLTAGGQLKVGDLGLVKSADQTTNTTLTRVGEVLGTPDYMSPEQGKGLEVDHRADIYSVAATYYALLTGKAPYQGTSEEVITAHCVQDAPDPRDINPDIPPAVTAVIHKAMSKDPRNRYDSVGQLEEELVQILENPNRPNWSGKSGIWMAPTPDNARTRWLLLAVVSSIVLTSILILWLLR